jgi:hypothetical protein
VIAKLGWLFGGDDKGSSSGSAEPDMPASPFDQIKQVNGGGREEWSARDAMPLLGYGSWQNFEPAIEKAKAACLSHGLKVEDHFMNDHKLLNRGDRGGTQKLKDVRMSRRGMYLLAMSGDSRKPEVAAAINYFAEMTRVAETKLHDIQNLPWSRRFATTYQPHYRHVQMNHPGCFSVLTASLGPILFAEDELKRHLLPLDQKDSPDGSIGKCWANYRRDTLGLPDPHRKSPIVMPVYGHTAYVNVYEEKERSSYESWLHKVYLPEKLPAYAENKAEWKPYGKLACASAADNVCRGLTGNAAKLPPKIVRELSVSGGFVQASKTKKLCS